MTVWTSDTPPLYAQEGDIWIAPCGLDELALARARELLWLRRSLAADLAPDWLVEMVLERWDGPATHTFLDAACSDMSRFVPWYWARYLTSRLQAKEAA